MSDGVFVQFVCQFFNLMVIQINVCQRFVCIVFSASHLILRIIVKQYTGSKNHSPH
jgi:hypothetical protein